MPTTRTRTVKTSGGDYSSLSGYEAGEQGDLPTLDEIRQAECYSFEDTDQCLIDGWTTDATRYIRIYTPAAERHDGKWNTSKYRIVVAADFQSCINNREAYVRLEGLQLAVTAGADGNPALKLYDNAAPSDNRVHECVFSDSGTGAGDPSIEINSATNDIRNCVIYGAAGAAAILVQNVFNTPAVTIDNCTLIGGTFGIQQTGGTVTVRNCYAHGGTDAYSGTMTRTTCAHSSATVFSGSTAEIAHSTANFTNVTGGTEDYHLVSGASSTLKTGGDDLSGSFTTDIDGQTRADWGIGADEFIAGGGFLALSEDAFLYQHSAV